MGTIICKTLSEWRHFKAPHSSVGSANEKASSITAPILSRTRKNGSWEGCKEHSSGKWWSARVARWTHSADSITTESYDRLTACAVRHASIASLLHMCVHAQEFYLKSWGRAGVHWLRASKIWLLPSWWSWAWRERAVLSWSMQRWSL